MVLIDEAKLSARTLQELVVPVEIRPDALRKSLDRLAEAGRVRFLSQSPPVVISDAVFRDTASSTLEHVLQFHETNPLAAGILKEELRSRFFERSSNLVFQTVLDDLVDRQKITVAHEIVHAFGRQVTLNAEETKIKDALAAEFELQGFQIVSPDEIIRKLRLERETAQKIIQLMIKDGALAKVSDELLVDGEAVRQIIAKLRARKKTAPTLGVGDFKDLVGVSRKYAIPLLEYLDRQRVTRRVGNDRVIL